MKKKVALPIIITGSVVGALLLCVLILSLITVNPLKTVIGDYSEVTVYLTGENGRQPNTEESRKAIKDGVDTTKFSVMHAILEGRFAYGAKFKTEKNDDGKDERVMKSGLELRLMSNETDNYMLKFSYDSLRTIKVQGEEVKFDNAYVIIYDTNGEIEKIEIMPYEYAKVTGNPTDEDYAYYKMPVIEIWSTTSGLYSVLNDYASLLK